MPATATPRKPQTLARKLVETRNTSRNRSLAAMLGVGQREKDAVRSAASAVNDVYGRGTLAGFLGIPGDLGGMAENGIRGLLGLEQVQPYGGSEHIGQLMQEYGLVSPTRRPVAETIASLVSPTGLYATAAKAPQAARAGVRALDNLANARGMGRGLGNSQVGAIENLWHGSPHTFDRFDLSKIGTGEGAQAYGHGAYLAESPEVAQTYQKIEIPGGSPAPPRRTLNGVDLEIGSPEYFAGSLLSRSGMTLKSARNLLKSWIDDPQYQKEMFATPELVDEWKKALETLNGVNSKSAFDSPKHAGNLYQTRLAWPDPAREATDPLSPDHFLHWDKPLSEQSPMVREAWASFTKENPVWLDPSKSGGQYKAPAGQDFYGAVFEGAPGMGVEARKAVTEYMAKQGIPGIRYLDGGSRGAGDGSHNYVVFDDRLIDIVSRNGQPVGNLGKMVAPQDEALRVAQQNAAKPIEEGGLGLRPDNTPEERAAAMGFNGDWYHGSPSPDIQSFNLDMVGKYSGNADREAVWATSNPANANGYALNWNSYKANQDAKSLDDRSSEILKGISKAWGKDPYEVARLKDELSAVNDMRSRLYNDFMDYGVSSDGSSVYPLVIRGSDSFPQIDAAGKNYMAVNNSAVDSAKAIGADGVVIRNVQDNAGTYAGSADSVATFDPRNIRSRFAAFDPMRRDSSDILAGLAPLGLGAWMYQDEPVK